MDKNFIPTKWMLMFALLFIGWSAMAATYTVTQITDNGTGSTTGSLSWAINAVADGDKIAFNLSSGDVVTLSAALPAIDNTLTMEGINIATGNPVTIQVTSPGVSAYRVFYINGGAAAASSKTITLNDLIMRGGDVSGLTAPANFGGVIYAPDRYGTVTLNRCVVKEGKAQSGGGIFSVNRISVSHSMNLNQCTVNNNVAMIFGGGLYINQGTILNSTISGNTAASGGGGIYEAANNVKLLIINSTISGNQDGGIYIAGSSMFKGSVYLLNCIIINNTATGLAKDIYDSYSGGSANFIWSSYSGSSGSISTAYTTGDLGVLADNGGPTQTMELSTTAPAYQIGTYAYYNATDGYYYYNGSAYVKLIGGFPATYHEADKILTDQRGETRSDPPSMGAFDGEAPSQPMQLVFTTTADNQSIELPLYGTVNCTVDWGDGSATEDFTIAGDKAHTFATAGTYTVEISGSLEHFGKDWNPWTGVGYLTEVISFGEIGLTSLFGAFVNADNLTSVPATLPAEITNLQDAFRTINQVSIANLDLWDISHVQNLSRVFFQSVNFNQDITGWNVSNVTDMNSLFWYAAAFDQDLSSWQIGAVTDMANMFDGVTLSTANYDAILTSWAAQTVQSGVAFHGGNSKYTCGGAVETARQSLIDDDAWTITDGGTFDNTNPVFTSTHNDLSVDANASCEASLADYTGDVTATDNTIAAISLT